MKGPTQLIGRVWWTKQIKRNTTMFFKVVAQDPVHPEKRGVDRGIGAIAISKTREKEGEGER